MASSEDKVFYISSESELLDTLGTEWVLIEDSTIKGLYRKVLTKNLSKSFVGGKNLDLDNIADSRVIRYNASEDKFYMSDIFSGENPTLSGLQTFDDDASAGTGGLTTDQVYKTSTGGLRIKL